MAAPRIPRRVSGPREVAPRRQATHDDVDAGLAIDDRPIARHRDITAATAAFDNREDRPMSRNRLFASAGTAFALALVACSDPASTAVSGAPSDASLNRAGFNEAAAHRQYGTPAKLGNGTIRIYVGLEEKNSGRPPGGGGARGGQSLKGWPARRARAGEI